MPTMLELQTMRAISDALPRIAAALEKIAIALTIKVVEPEEQEVP